MISVHATGRISQDPRYTEGKDGKRSVIHFNMAIDRRLSKEQREKEGAVTADFPSFVAWGSTADFIHKYFHKGDAIEITSDQITTGSYDDKDGKKVYTTEINVRQAAFVGNKSNSQNQATPDSAPQTTTAPQNTGGVADVPADNADEDFDFSL